MTRDLTSDNPLPPDRLAHEAILDGYRNPADTQAACTRVSQRLFRLTPVSDHRAPLRWQFLVRTAAVVAIAAGLWMTILRDDTQSAITMSSQIDHDRGFPEMRVVALQLTLLEEDISRLDENHFWGDSRLRPMSRTPMSRTKEIYQR